MVNKKESNLWENIYRDDFHQKNKSIKSFRQIGGFNNRVSGWDPIENSSRYFKSLLYAFAENLDNRIIQSEIFHQKDNKLGDGIKYYLKKIRHRSLGRPITINYYNNIVDMGIFEGIFIDGAKTAGEAVAYGKLAINEIYPQNPNDNVYLFSTWNNLMGDASTHLWTKRPEQMIVNHV